MTVEALIDGPGAQVHDQDGIGDALGEATEVADQHGERAAAHAVEQLAVEGHRAGGIVGSHEDGAQHQAAGHQVVEHPVHIAVALMAEDQAEDSHGAQIGAGDTPGDDLGGQQVGAADQQGQGAQLTDAAGDGAQQQGLEAHVSGHGSAGIQVGQRSCHGDAVNGGGQGLGHSVAAHDGGVGRQQESTAGQGGVQEVLADAAVELLHHHDGKEVADDGQPPGSVGGENESQQQTGQAGGQVAHGAGLLHQLAVAPLKEHGGGHRDQGQHQGVNAILPNGHSQSRHQGQDDVEHDALGVGSSPYLGLIRNVKDNSFFILAHFLASFAAASASALAFSLADLTWNMILAVLKAWVRGILAGQLKEQLPHSKQSIT